MAALPVTTTVHAEHLAGAHHKRIRYTKLSAPALMDAAEQPGVGFAADGDGGFILPGFLPAFDAAAALVKVLDLLARGPVMRSLSAVVAGLPRVHIAHETVSTPWEHKGMVMRSLIEQGKDRPLVLVDGVKVVHEGGWALAVPDPEAALTHVWAEAGSDADARQLAHEYSRRIRQLLR